MNADAPIDDSKQQPGPYRVCVRCGREGHLSHSCKNVPVMPDTVPEPKPDEPDIELYLPFG